MTVIPVAYICLIGRGLLSKINIDKHLHTFHRSLLFSMMFMPHSSVIVDVHPTHIYLHMSYQRNKHVVDGPCQ